MYETPLFFYLNLYDVLYEFIYNSVCEYIPEKKNNIGKHLETGQKKK